MPNDRERQIARDKKIELVLESLLRIEKKLNIKENSDEGKQSKEAKKTGWFSSEKKSSGSEG